MNVLMLTKSRYGDDVRVRREAETLSDMGNQVTVLALDGPDRSQDGVSVVGLGETSGLRRGEGSATATVLHRMARWLLLPEHRARATDQFRQRSLAAARRLPDRPDVVHAHDFPALAPAAELAAEAGARLVYDAHEFWAGMPRYGRPEPIRKARDLAKERRLARSADAVLTVSDAAAELIERELGVGCVVVRNTFPARVDLEAPTAPRGVVYAGRIGAGRDLETVMSPSVWESSGLELHLMGPRDPSFHVLTGPIVHESGSLDLVDRLLAEMGIAVIPLRRGPLNHDIALPNKLFQAISVGVPVVAADLPQMASVVEANRLGALYQPGDAGSLADALARVVDDYPSFREHVKSSRDDFDWEVDAEVLRAVYSKLS